MKFIKKLFKAFFIMLSIGVVVIIGLVIALEASGPPEHKYLLTEDQVKELIIEQVSPQLPAIAAESGFDSLVLDLQMFDFQIKEANDFEDGTISVRVMEHYSGGPFVELEAGVFNPDTYYKYAKIKRPDYSNVKIDKYTVEVTLDTNGITFYDTQGNIYWFALGLINKNGETVDNSLFWPDWDEFQEKFGGYGRSYVADAFEGESFPDYVKRVAPDLYKTMQSRYNQATRGY